MTNLFTYGSLMFPEVIYKLTTRQDYSKANAVLHNFARRRVKARVYPGITPLQGACVNGVVYYGLIQEDIQILTAFENVEYVPTVVTVEAD
jgi:gamma-glutamylcyclotransferase (GGCT)/AIG2-like uncharacterized protein YtfP